MAAVHLNTIDDALVFLRARGVAGLTSDTRRLRHGDAFVAWPGFATDPRRFVKPALHVGAAACVIDADEAGAYGFDDDRIGVLRGLKAAAGELASRWYGEPSRRLDLIAVTGTNGKTSTAWWTAQLLSAGGRRCGLIGTLGAGLPFDAAGERLDPVEPTGFTTPDPVALQSMLHRFAAAGSTACAIEASSIGIDECRMEGARVALAQFTNFTRDHLDYHGTMEAYWAAKARLFEWPGLRAAIINIDDEHGRALAASMAPRAGRDIDLWTVGIGGSEARLCARDIAYGVGAEGAGLSFTLTEGAQSHRLRTPLIGTYNVSNLLGVLGALRAEGVPLADLIEPCARLHAVPGRMERVDLPRAADAAPALPLAVVDYAHTPDALDQALRALRPLAQARGGRLWCVFGCGGNRDATKRPLMGAIAQQRADRVVATSDNPRDEAPGFILSQILAGLCGRDEVDVIEDRAEAIRYALSRAAAADVVLVAGKGHETTQEVAGRKVPFSDVEHARTALLERAGAGVASDAGGRA